MPAFTLPKRLLPIGLLGLSTLMAAACSHAGDSAAVSSASQTAQTAGRGKPYWW
ncbi:MAG: hypothetical protein Q4C79_06800 [Neisseria sp.]|uniref:hypothetical protein n=1 Tax=Neisseria sp. TaxID=192066 RepID=UPI0026DD6A6E|nr:hypothetical protein [Neisseria sp.]MDO4248653.1 hypothetical protein [Neisseria sp.]